MKLEYSSILRVRLRPETARHLEVEARRRGTNISALMRQFIEAGLVGSAPSNPKAGGTAGSSTITTTPGPTEIPVTTPPSEEKNDELDSEEIEKWLDKANARRE
jgi:hypothetical protein